MSTSTHDTPQVIRASLSTPRIVFLVIAAAAPLASLIGNLPIALARGNGAGTPVAFAIAGAILLCFAVGYAAMSRRIVNTGAFYTYITEGLGASAGIGSAYTALVAYLAFTFGLAISFGYFTSLVLGEAGLHVPWPVFAAIGLVLVAVLGYRSIDFSSVVLGALMIGEVAILMIFDATVLVAKGPALALPAQAWSPHLAFTPGLGVSLMVAFTCFIGFESAALYGEEARDPKRSIPIATYTAVISIAIFYLFTAWVVVGALLPDDVAARAAKENGELLFNVFTRYGGEVLTDIMGVFLCLSILATYLAIHNAASRYIFALGREWLLPPWFGAANPRSGAPSRASLTVTALTAVAMLPIALSGLDPYKAGMPVLIGFGSFGIIFLQAFAAIAIVVYLRRDRGEPAWVMAATWVGAVGLVAATLFVAVYFKLLATSDAGWVGWLPFVFPAIVLPILAFGLWSRTIRPKLIVIPADHSQPTAAPAGFTIRGGEGCRPVRREVHRHVRPRAVERAEADARGRAARSASPAGQPRRDDLGDRGGLRRASSAVSRGRMCGDASVLAARQLGRVGRDDSVQLVAADRQLAIGDLAGAVDGAERRVLDEAVPGREGDVLGERRVRRDRLGGDLDTSEPDAARADRRPGDRRILDRLAWRIGLHVGAEVEEEGRFGEIAGQRAREPVRAVERARLACRRRLRDPFHRRAADRAGQGAEIALRQRRGRPAVGEADEAQEQRQAHDEPQAEAELVQQALARPHEALVQLDVVIEVAGEEGLAVDQDEVLRVLVLLAFEQLAARHAQ